MRSHRLPLTTILPLLLGLSTLAYHGPASVWARSHAGDALAVAFLVGLLGALTPWPRRLRLILIAMIATVIELSQLGAGASEHGTVTRLFIGSHYDALDFLYYGAGLLLALGLELSADTFFTPNPP